MPIELIGAAALVILVAVIYGGVLLWRRWRADNPEPRETYRYGAAKVPQFHSDVRLAELVRSGYRWDHLCVKTCCLDDTSISCNTCVLHRKNSVSRSKFLARVGRSNSYRGLMIPSADPSLELVDALRNCYECRSSKPEQRCQGLQCIPGAVCDQCLACATHASVLKDYLRYTEGEEKMADGFDEEPQSSNSRKWFMTILDSFNGIESDANILKLIDNKKEGKKMGAYFKGFRIPDFAVGVNKYKTLADAMLDGHVEGACWYVNCVGLSCSNCALHGTPPRRELVEFFKQEKEKEKNEMKKDKQTVAEDLVSKYAVTLGTDSTFSNTTYSVMLAPKYGDARDLITHLQSRCIYPHTEPIRWGDYNMVLVPVGLSNTTAELADRRAKLVFAVEEFIQSGQEVRRFLNDIEACAAGSKFALKYKSMRQVWQAMIDDEQWGYMDYVVQKLTELSVEDAQYRFEYVLAYDSRLDMLKKLRRLLGEHLGSKLAKSVIEELNPFARRADD